MKKCNKCFMEKEDEKFAINNRTKDGLSYDCKECRNVYFKKRYHENIEREREKNKKKYENNKSYFIEHSRLSREKNPEKWKEYDKKRRKTEGYRKKENKNIKRNTKMISITE